MKLTGAQIIMESLLAEGVDTVFGYPGGANLPMYDTLPQYPQLRHVLVRHEQAAAHAADAYARITGRAGVCWATSGPGATNLVTGIANAWMDSVPVVCITGSVVSWLIGRDGFQEADITGITIPITKHNTLVLNVEDIATAIKEAFHIATTGRPGPVLVDIPRDVQQQETEFKYPDSVNLPGYEPPAHGDARQIKRAAQLIADAERPVILAGHGVIISRAWDELVHLAETAQIPVITTLLGIGGFPGTHKLNMGMPGMHGMYWNNMAISEADLVMGIGMRFDDRVTGSLKDFAPKAKIVHIDIDPAEIGKNLTVAVPVVGDVKQVLTELNREVQPKRHDEWLAWLQEQRDAHPSIVIPETEKLLPQYVIKSIYDASGSDAYYVTGVGQHQMWAAQYFWVDKPNGFITSGGLGTMGFEVPAAIGAQFADLKSTVWSICGDGGFQMTSQELATIVQEGLHVRICIMNNGALGMVRQWQMRIHGGRRVASDLGAPDFAALALAYRIHAETIEKAGELDSALDRAATWPGPVLLDLRIPADDEVYPMVPAGAALNEMWIKAPGEKVAP